MCPNRLKPAICRFVTKFLFSQPIHFVAQQSLLKEDLENPQFFSDLFRKYLENRCSPEETESLRKLLTMDEYKVYANVLIEEQIGREADIHFVDFDLNSRLEARLQNILEINDTPASNRRVVFPTQWRWMAAACLLLALSAIVYFQLPYQEKPEVALIYPPFFAPTSVGYIRHIVLPDGSSVVLHAGSKLQYPASFNVQTREVTLTGEAYFDITSNPEKPFIIHTGKVKTTVLGTAFNIKSDGRQVIVSVTRGKVKVENESKVLAVLTPDQQVLYDVPDEKIAHQTVNANNIVTDWTKEDMVFNGISFEEIAKILSKRYGVAVWFKNEALKNCKIRASFAGTEKLEQVSSVLCAIRNGSYEQMADGTIVLDGEGCE